ncbi:MAG: glycerol-3-phosphate dehydrogenase/oxidase [Microbacteriaceae bacterium]|nr:glycerol-3-phosphate dehydrogenase/oxidase [Microbacteriaceae bacterium]
MCALLDRLCQLRKYYEDHPYLQPRKVNIVTPNSPTSQARTTVTQLISRPHAQVLIIGAGINGIATFRDLALQGIDVALVERSDYVSGASAASSHMIHGGIRYLENGEFRLVKESVTERNRLIKLAPHYVKPLKTTVPIFSTFSGVLAAPLRFLTHKQGKPQERGALLIKVGLTMYDSFSRDGGAVPRHEFRGKKESLRQLPQLNPDIAYTATYYDASMHDPERLALDVLFDALAAKGPARAANYVEAVGSDASGITLRDRETGETFQFTAEVIINTSGPWTDLTNAALGKATVFMGGTKGSHIVLDNAELLAATAGREIFFEHKDGRIVLIYPVKGKIMVGTTDIDADPSTPSRCTEDEVDYFFDLIGHVFPDITVDRSQIVFRFSGIRPLPRHDDEQPGFVSRDYRIEAGTVANTPLLSLVGGKWTTFRALAEHLGNEALALLKMPRTASTASLAIGGGVGFPNTSADRTRWVSAHAGNRSAAVTDALLERYGTKAIEVMTYLDLEPDAELVNDRSFTRREIERLVIGENAVHLIDLLLRRTNLAFTGSLTLELVEELGRIIGATLDWSAEQISAEIAASLAELKDAHSVELTARLTSKR